MKTIAIRSNPHHLDAVQQLWRQDSSTLGFFPQGAFADYAAKGGLIAAIDRDEHLIGYLAFRRSRQQAVIVHLCVGSQFRGRGVAKLLFDAFQTATSELFGARVTCRKDFEAASLWPKLGFICVGERPGREPGRTLQRWWLDYGHPTLFTCFATGPIAVLDANVFFDLQSSETERNESHALRASWTQDVFTLAITPELYNEIARGEDQALKKRNRLAATLYEQIGGRSDEVSRVCAELGAVFGTSRSPRDESDVRQLAHAIACDASFFVTRDKGLLDKATAIRLAHHIEVLRPSALISRFDEDVRPSRYSPSRLDGSSLTVRLLRSADINRLAKVFQNFPRGEKNTGLVHRLREAVGHVGTWCTEVVEDEGGNPLCLAATEDRGVATSVQALRYRAGSLGSTLAKHMLWRHVVQAEARGHDCVLFHDDFAPDDISEALTEIGFIRTDAQWIKPIIRAVSTRTDVIASLIGSAASGRFPASMADVIMPVTASQLPAFSASMEAAIWPGKVCDGGLRSYVVPIQPRWAAQLFDTEMASENLFPADAALLLRFENAYYRAARPRIIEPGPARVLWYVSEEVGQRHSKQLRASSLITSVQTGSAKSIFKRYRRYGVFNWSDVSSLAGKASRTVMAFSFSHTTPLARPVPFKVARKILKRRLGKTYTFQSPIELPEAVWMELYEMGFASEAQDG